MLSRVLGDVGLINMKDICYSNRIIIASLRCGRFGINGRRLSILFITIVLSVIALPDTGLASIAFDGDAAFKQSVESCFEIIKSNGGEPADILNQLMQPQGPHSHKTTITPRDLNDPADPGVNWERPTDGAATFPNGGQPGAGSDNTIHWSPDDRSELEPGVNRDPCSSLLHEMTHAAHDGNGTTPPPPNPPVNTIDPWEVQACTVENMYRKKHPPLPQRRTFIVRVENPPGVVNWVEVPLPPSAIF
jgi:hypothetical protein